MPILPPPDGKDSLVIDPSDFDLVIWDEAHMYLTRNAQLLVQRFRHAMNLGLTATPRYYEGKEAPHVFGRAIYELDLETAKERKEIPDFRNILITTDIRTGLQLSSPDQEESADVTRAIDVPGRNNIFPHVYRNATIMVNGQEFTLAGEHAVVFVAGIDHTHTLAQAFNDALMPALRKDEAFRALLRGKGIDPDAVECIATPIHSGSTEQHPSMDLEARNALESRYNERKVLVLVATSVLQQSWDNERTSVIMDAVPRQTYVGVGQAGMRALRWLPEKKMAFLLNVQDADHPSLTFLDFQGARGREEGIAVEIGQTGNGGEGDLSDQERPRAKYDVTHGTSLVDLSSRRRRDQEEAASQNATAIRHFTAPEYQKISELLGAIAVGNREAANTFVTMIQPWIEAVCSRIGTQIFGNVYVDDHDLADVNDILADLIKAIEGNAIQSWWRFSMQFQNKVRNRYRNTQSRKLQRKEQSLSEKQWQRIPAPECDELCQAELRDAIPDAFRYLHPREKDILVRSINGEQLEEIGKIYKITGSRVRSIKIRAQHKLQNSMFLPEAIQLWLKEQENALAILEAEERQKAREKQLERNKEILQEIGPDFLAQKRIIFDILKGKGDVVYSGSIHLKTGIPQTFVETITDTTETDIRVLSYRLVGEFSGEKLLFSDHLERQLPFLETTTRDSASFARAICALHILLKKFEEMGGEPDLYPY